MVEVVYVWFSSSVLSTVNGSRISYQHCALFALCQGPLLCRLRQIQPVLDGGNFCTIMEIWVERFKINSRYLHA